MGLFKVLFGSKSKNSEKKIKGYENEFNFGGDVEEKKLNVSGWEVTGGNYEDQLSRSRLYICDEYIGDYPEKYKRSLNSAIDYLNEQFRKSVISICRYCNTSRVYPVMVTKIKHIIIYRDIPDYKFIADGWRVSRVKCELGEADVIFAVADRAYMKINWNFKLGEVCNKCAQKLRELGRTEELSKVLPSFEPK